jgi:DNA-binding protein H-NS
MPSMFEKVKQRLSELSVRELREVIAQAEALHSRKRDQEKGAFLDEVRRMAAERGLDVADVFASPSRARATPTVKAPPKYRNPDNPRQVWSGRGRAPAWAAPYKKAGKLDQIAIADVVASSRPSRAKAAPAAKAAPNPDNPQQVWNGRGRAPAWAAAYKNAGKLDEIAIQ